MAPPMAPGAGGSGMALPPSMAPSFGASGLMPPPSKSMNISASTMPTSESLLMPEPASNMENLLSLDAEDEGEYGAEGMMKAEPNLEMMLAGEPE